MQIAFDFALSDRLGWMRDRLRARIAGYRPAAIREPIGQMVKSLLSSRTRDEVSLKSYARLLRRFPLWRNIADASVVEIADTIEHVTFAEDKAGHLRSALRLIARDHPDFDLSFLKARPVPDALAWLEALPGVGRKVAASTLNFSTLAMPAFVVDSHVLRVLTRFGAVGPRADTVAAYDAVMMETPDWSALELSEFHVLTKRLGQTVCTFNQPRCRECPLFSRCRYRVAGITLPAPARADPALKATGHR